MTVAAVPFSENFVDWLWIALGVLIAVVWPWLRRKVASIVGWETASAGQDVRKAAILLAFAAVTAILVLAIYRSAKPDAVILWYAALLAGFGWESTIEKVLGVTTKKGSS